MDVTITAVDKCELFANIVALALICKSHFVMLIVVDSRTVSTNFAETACQTTPLSSLVGELLASAHTQN